MNTVARLGIASILALTGTASGAPTGSLGAQDQPVDLGHGAYEGRRVVRVTPSTMRDFMAVSSIASDILNERPSPGQALLVVVNDAGFAAMRDLGLAPETVIGDLRAHLIAFDAENTAARLGTPGFDYLAYYPLADIEQKLADLVAAHPGVVTPEIIGQSLEGRDIRMLRITGPGPNLGRPKILINSLQHAREWITPPATVYLAEQLLAGYGSDAEITDLLDNVEFLIIPVVNPDGYEYSWNSVRFWRKNRRNNGNGTEGVDLNRNWSFAFGGPGSSGSGGSETYRGPFALSEPETQAVAGVFTSNPDIVAHVDTHSFSQLVLYPFGTSTDQPADRRLFEVWSRDMTDRIFEKNGRPYTPQRGIDLYAASGIMTDYAYGERDALSWTFELRPRNSQAGGFAPAQDQILPTAEEIFEAYMDLARGVRARLRSSVPMAADAPLADGEARSFVLEIFPVVDNVQPSSVRAVMTTGGTETPIAGVHLGGDTYQITLPPASCDDGVSFRVEADTLSGETAVLGGSPTLEFNPSVGTYSPGFQEGFSSGADGWVIASDALRGAWTRSTLNGAGASPENDADGDGFAMVTGAGSSDIDEGETELMSPVFNPGQRGRISYSYWLDGSFDRADQMTVEVFDGSDWIEVRRYTTAAPVWRRDSISVGPDGEVPSWVGSRVRFRARDVLDASTVEAAIDAFSVETLTSECGDTCPADVNGDGVADPADFTAWLAFFNTPSLPGSERADVNGDGNIDPADFTAWLAAFNQGC